MNFKTLIKFILIQSNLFSFEFLRKLKCECNDDGENDDGENDDGENSN